MRQRAGRNAMAPRCRSTNTKRCFRCWAPPMAVMASHLPAARSAQPPALQRGRQLPPRPDRWRGERHAVECPDSAALAHGRLQRPGWRGVQPEVLLRWPAKWSSRKNCMTSLRPLSMPTVGRLSIRVRRMAWLFRHVVRRSFRARGASRAFACGPVVRPGGAPSRSPASAGLLIVPASQVIRRRGTSAVVRSGSGGAACAAPWLRSGGCVRASRRTACRLLPACGRCSCRCRSACAALSLRAA